ncbi:MAG: carbohydrate binding domain-containing protein, partial [Lutibacter sp.]
TYTLTLIANSGAGDARVFFDLGAAAGSVNIDNVSLFLGNGPFDDGLITNGNFESGAEPWTIGVGTDPAPVVTVGGNTYYSVNVATAGQPYEVNVSQKLEIIEGKTYTLSFDAWSDTNRPILPGIGLSAAPWTNITEEVNITTTKQTYTLTLIANSGASDARVFFDLGAAAGSVNIDNVSLFIAN